MIPKNLSIQESCSSQLFRLVIILQPKLNNIESYLQFNRIVQQIKYFMIRFFNKGKNAMTIFNSSYLSFFQVNRLIQKSIYTTAFAQKRKKRKEQMKPYQILLYSSPVSQINMYALMSSSQLRPNAANRLLMRASRFPQQYINSTQIQIQSLFFLQQTKNFQKGFVLLVQNLLKIIKSDQQLDKCGIFKPGIMQKLLFIIEKFDSLHAESCIQMLSVFIIKTIEKSNINKKAFDQQKKEIEARMEDFQPIIKDQNLSQEQKKQIFNEYLIQRQLLVHLEWKYPYFQQEDYIIALNFLLQKGYHNKSIINQVTDIIEKDYNLETAKQMTENRQKQNKNSHICCLFKLINSKLTLLNSLKYFKSHTHDVKNIKRQAKQKQKSPLQKSNDKIGADQYISKVSKQKKVELDIQLSIISETQYKKLVKTYIDMLQNPEYLFYLLDDKTVMLLQNLQTDFYTYIPNKISKQKQIITMADIKKSYINMLKVIFNVQKNGIIYAQNKNILGIFQIVIKLFDYQDRHDVVQLLKLFQHFSLMTNLKQFQNYSVFYVCEKYKYRSNFLASKYIKSIIRKYNSGKDQISLKEQMVFGGVQMCKHLSLYFKLLQSNQKLTLSSTIQQYNDEINQAIEFFLTHYNKLISVLYFEDQKLGFIDKCVQMSYEILRRKKVFKNGEDDFTITQDIRYILKNQHKLTKVFIQSLQIKNAYFDIEKIMVQRKSQKSQKSQKDQKKQYKNEQVKKWREKDDKKNKTQNIYVQEVIDYSTHSHFIKHQTNLEILAQISTIFDIVLTAIKLQKHKNMLNMEDAHVILKNVFSSQKNKKFILQSMAYPKLLKNLFQIGNHFKNQSNENMLWKLIYKSTKFNLNQIIRDQRINFAKEGKSIFSLDDQIQLKTEFQEHLTSLTLSPISFQNAKIQTLKDYEPTPINIMTNVRSDVIYSADKIYFDLKKIAKAQLMDIYQKSKNKNIKIQNGYLQYPYLADIAIGKNNQVTIILIRGKDHSIKNVQRTSDKAVEEYLDECQQYYRQGKMTVCIVTNLVQLKQLIRAIFN